MHLQRFAKNYTCFFGNHLPGNSLFENVTTRETSANRFDPPAVNHVSAVEMRRSVVVLGLQLFAILHFHFAVAAAFLL